MPTYRDYSTPEEMFDDICEPEQPYQLPEWIERVPGAFIVHGRFLSDEDARDLADAIEHYQRAD